MLHRGAKKGDLRLQFKNCISRPKIPPGLSPAQHSKPCWDPLQPGTPNPTVTSQTHHSHPCWNPSTWHPNLDQDPYQPSPIKHPKLCQDLPSQGNPNPAGTSTSWHLKHFWDSLSPASQTPTGPLSHQDSLNPALQTSARFPQPSTPVLSRTPILISILISTSISVLIHIHNSCPHHSLPTSPF